MARNQSKHIAGGIVYGVLTAFGVVASVISMTGGSKGIWLLGDCAQIVLFIAIAYYAVIGYKRPHGNLLKYIMLLFAARYLLMIPILVPNGIAWRVVLDALQIGLICYVAGRLNKAKENFILMIAVTVCIIWAIITDAVSGIATIGAVSPLIIWIDICVAYVLRYGEHRKAGLTDATKK